MIVSSVLGCLEDFDLKGRKVDYVKVHPDDRLKHILRLQSDDGVEIGLQLESGHIHPNDVLAEDERAVYVVQILPQDVIILRCTDLMQMAFAAHSIGNRHTPAVFEDGAMIIEYDYLIAAWLDEQNIPYERCEKVLRHALKHASHTH